VNYLSLPFAGFEPLPAKLNTQVENIANLPILLTFQFYKKYSFIAVMGHLQV
jgi:hypothetical protein